MPIKNRQQILTVLAMAGAALFLIDRVVAPPVAKLWRERSARIAELRTKVHDGRQLIKREEAIHSRWREMQRNTLPNDASRAQEQLVKGFDQWAQESQVNINSVMPQWKQDSDDYKTLELRVDASGNLATLSRFLYKIEGDPMALKVQSVELTARDNEGQQLTLALQVSGLVLTPKEGPQ